MATKPVQLANGIQVRLTLGEIEALRRYAKMNGRATGKVLYDPGYVRYDTVANLVRKGIMIRNERGLNFWAPGVFSA